MKYNTNDLTSGNVLHTLLRFFWPLLLANLLQSLYGIVDMLVIGWYVGSIGLAAVSNASILIFVVTSLSIGIGTGGTVRIGYFVGADLRHRIKPTVDSMLTLSTIMSLAVTVALLAWLAPILTLLQIPKEAMRDASSYMTITTMGTVFVFGFNAASSLLRGLGDSQRPMHFIIVATVVNIVLDLLFVGPMNLGVKGAAYATIAAQAAACLISLRRLYFGLGNGRPAPCMTEAVPILKTGMATAIQLIVVNISYAWVAAMLNTYGVDVAAAAGIGIKINTFAAMPCWAFGNAITTMTSQCLGGQKIARAKTALRQGLGLNLLFSLTLVLTINGAAELILFLFNPDNSEVTRIGVRYLRLCCSVNCLLYCTMYTLDAFATGAGDAFVAMVNSLLDSFVIRLSLSWLLATHCELGYDGIFLAQALAPIVPAVIGMGYYLSGIWMRHHTTLR